jgi:hypothetical protein
MTQPGASKLRLTAFMSSQTRTTSISAHASPLLLPCPRLLLWKGQPTCQAVGHVDGDGDDKAGDDAGLVAQGQAKDDVSGRAGTASISHVLGLFGGRGHGRQRATQHAVKLESGGGDGVHVLGMVANCTPAATAGDTPGCCSIPGLCAAHTQLFSAPARACSGWM